MKEYYNEIQCFNCNRSTGVYMIDDGSPNGFMICQDCYDNEESEEDQNED